MTAPIAILTASRVNRRSVDPMIVRAHWLLCMCSIVVAFHGRASKVCGVVGEAATSRCLGGPEAPLEASPDDACARETRPGSAETGAAAAPGTWERVGHNKRLSRFFG